MIGDVLRSRRAHRRALRLWSDRRHDAACAAEQRAIDLVTRSRPHTPARIAELAAIISTRAGFAAARTDHATAVHLQQAVVRLAAELPAGNDRDALLAAAHITLGATRRLRGEYDTALDELRAAESIVDRSQLDATSAAAVANALGVLAKDTGRYDDAAHHYADAITALDRVADHRHPLHATVQHNLAGLAHSRGRFADGEAPARRAVELRRRTPTATATDVAADQTVLGAVLAGQGRHEEAEALFRHAISVWSTNHTPEHYEVAVNLHNLAAVQQARGDLADAEASYGAALAIKERLLGPTHAEIGALLNNLAALAAEQGRPARATGLYDRALTVLEATLGPDHPHARACRANAAAAPASCAPPR